LIAGSVSSIGFGLDSFIEVTSGAALLWRLHRDLNRSGREQVEQTTLGIVVCRFGVSISELGIASGDSALLNLRQVERRL
jgi:hypothetical protein